MRSRNRAMIVGLALAAAMGIYGCAGSEEGTAEQAGKQIDEAVQGAADAAGEAMQAGTNAVDDAAGAAADAAKNAAEAVGDAAQ